MKKRGILAMALVVIQVLGQAAFSAETGETRVSEAGIGSLPEQAYAQELYEHGYWKGTERGYELEREVTRAEALTMIYRICGIVPELDGGGAEPFLRRTGAALGKGYHPVCL